MADNQTCPICSATVEYAETVAYIKDDPEAIGGGEVKVPLESHIYRCPTHGLLRIYISGAHELYVEPRLIPETPDFNAIAARVLVDLEPLAEEETLQCMAVVAEQLRLVWNARGAADIATLVATVPDTISSTDGGFMKQLDHALRTLDR